MSNINLATAMNMPDGTKVYFEDSTVRDIICNEYDSAETYTKGEYCRYNNTLYECTTTIGTPEVWTSAHWTPTNVGNELTSVSSNFANKVAKSYGKGTHSISTFIYGFVTTGGTQLSVTIPLCIERDVTNITNASSSAWQIRIPSGGYLTFDTPTSVTPQIVSNGLRIVFEKTGGWGVTNNIPISGEMTLTFTLS